MNTKAKFRVVVPLALLAVVGLAQENPPTPAVAAEDKPAAAKPPMKQIGGLRFLDVSELTVVNVDVSVSGKKGPVFNLTADDFDVYQDRKPVPLTNFSAFTKNTEHKATPAPASTAVPAPATPTPEPATPPKREPRFVAFYIDNENLMPFDRNRVINRMVEWIDTNLTPPDQAMVVSYAAQSMKIIQPFTSDPDEIASALRSVKKFVGGRSDTINSRQRIEDDINQNSSGSGSGSGSSSNDPTQVLSEARSFVVRKYVVDNFQLDDTRLKTLGLGKSGDAGPDGSLQILIYSGAHSTEARKVAAKK